MRNKKAKAIRKQAVGFAVAAYGTADKATTYKTGNKGKSILIEMGQIDNQGNSVKTPFNNPDQVVLDEDCQRSVYKDFKRIAKQ